MIKRIAVRINDTLPTVEEFTEGDIIICEGFNQKFFGKESYYSSLQATDVHSGIYMRPVVFGEDITNMLKTKVGRNLLGVAYEIYFDLYSKYPDVFDDN